MPRVLELGSSVAVGYCGRLLGMMGAEVTRVESGFHPDTMNALDEYLGCYKSSVALGSDTAAGGQALERLYRQAVRRL